MTTRNALLAAILRRVADAIEPLPEAELERLAAGPVQVVPSGAADRPKADRPAKASLLTEAEMEAIRRELEGLDSRDAGSALLEQRCPTREHLKKLTKWCDLPVRKDEPRERMIENIVEATIGYRLRSKAIQGGDAKK